VIIQGALAGDEWSGPMAWMPESFPQITPVGTRVRVAPLMEDGRDKWVEDASLWPEAEDLPNLPGVVHTDRLLAVAASRIEVSIEEFAASLRAGGRGGEGGGGRGAAGEGRGGGEELREEDGGGRCVGYGRPDDRLLPSLYADGASNLDGSFAFLSKSIPQPPALADLLQFRRADLWLGSRTLSTLHFDNFENVFAQLVGDKEFVLCPPGDSAKLTDGRLRKAYASWRSDEAGASPGTFERTADGISEETVLNYAAYDIDEPPAQYAEAASKLRRQTVIVRAGEILFLPFGWWHQVRAIPGPHGLCASAAFFYEPFFCRFQPKSYSHLGPVLPNPKYRSLCERLKLAESDDEEDGGEKDDDRKEGPGEEEVE